MNKRGVSEHLDWIIGMSLFMLYILFMVITLKPGIQPLHTGDTLLSIIQNNFIDNVTWNITRVPLNLVASPTSGCENLFSIDFPFNWINNIKIYNNNIPVEFGMSGSSLVIFYGNQVVGKKEYIILHSDDESFSGAVSQKTGCTNGVTYIYGIPELLTGLSDLRISGLVTNANEDYEKLKTKLNYPITNDFTILVDGLAIHDVVPPSNANVYVRQFTDFILKNTGEKIPVTVTIKVW